METSPFISRENVLSFRLPEKGRDRGKYKKAQE